MSSHLPSILPRSFEMTKTLSVSGFWVQSFGFGVSDFGDWVPNRALSSEPPKPNLLQTLKRFEAFGF